MSYTNRMKAKYTVNWGVQIAGMTFLTHSILIYFTIKIAFAISLTMKGVYHAFF